MPQIRPLVDTAHSKGFTYLLTYSLVGLCCYFFHTEEVSTKQVSYEPVDAEGAEITGLIVALVLSLLIGFIVVLDIIALINKISHRSRHRRRVL